MRFQKILVAIDGSPGGQKALDTAIEHARLTRAELHALAVEGKLPAYAATIGEVDEVTKRFFQPESTADEDAPSGEPLPEPI